jgi:hypothetical protein
MWRTWRKLFFVIGNCISANAPVPVSESDDHRHGPSCYRSRGPGEDYRWEVGLSLELGVS